MNTNSPQLGWSWMRGGLVAANLVMAVVLGVLVARTPVVQAKLSDWKLVPRPESYTELYFVNSVGLPTAAGAAPVRFAFEIHNREGRSTVYPYEILVTGSNHATMLAGAGTVTVADGATLEVPEALVLSKADTGGRMQIAVYLPNQSQAIDFWLGAAK